VKILLHTLLPVLSIFLTLACKGESGITPVRLGITPDFEPAAATPSSDSVSLQKSTVNGENITLDVVVTDVSEPISGIAIKLMFPGDIAQFEGCSDGDLLPAGTCYVSQTPLHTDEVFIGRTIVNPDQPVPAVGSRTILRLKFLVFGTGTGNTDVIFEAPNLGGGDASALLDANGDPIFVKNWYGGILSGQ
jgi:hypothetical protein